jgi:peptide/nickel transport system substrate-binding protein
MDQNRPSAPHISRRSLVKGAAAAGAAIMCVPALGANGAPAPAFQHLSLLNQEGTPGGTLYVAMPFDFTATINPMVGNTDPYIFSHLLKWDGQLNPGPSLAKDWTISDDGLVYTFNLVDNATWHDGTPLTAHDVVFTVQTALLPETNFLFKFALQVGGVDITVEAPDDYTVVFTLPAPNATFLAHLASPWVLQIVPKHLLEGENMDTTDFGINPIGSGPFKFVEKVDGDHMTYARNEAYFGGAPLLEEVIVRPIVDMQARIAAFQAGEIDIDNREEDLISTAQFAETEGSTPYILQTPYVQQFTLNAEDPLFSDANVRRAIAYALDRPAMVRSVIGDESLAAQSVMGPGHWAYNDSLETYPYNVDMANQLLDEAGWVREGDGLRTKDGVEFSFTNYAWRDFERGYAPLIQQYLAVVGIQMNIEQVPDWATIQEHRLGGVAQSLFYGSIDYEPGELHQYFHSTQFTPTGQNVWHYGNPELDALLDAGNATIDQAERIEIYKQVQQIIIDECATIPMHVHINNVIVRTDRVAGYPEPTGNWLGVIFNDPVNLHLLNP